MVVVLLVALLCATIFAAEPDYVETKNGLVMGEAYEKHREFKGIPYGAAPTGERRFASPQPAAPWAPHVYNATSYGAICPCPGNVAVGALPFVHVDEDCLFLNVYAPSRDRISEPLPVMFWMYGGAYIFGDGHSLGLYDGDYLATTRDVIVVTINYRLAAFGFFYIEGKANGNQGIEDQRLALQWTIDNIANFGGDPKRITIFGESAGAMSVAAHLTSPLSAGMFQRAIMQSDPASLHWKTPAQATDISDKVARNVRCDEGDIDCLREVGWRELAYIRIPTFPAGIEDLVGDFLTWTPTVDGANLMKDTVDAFAAGEFNDVPVIIGTNRDEMSLFEGLIDFFGLIRIGPILYEIIIGIAFQDAKDAVLKQYPAKLIENNYHQIFQVFSDYIFKCSSRNVANSLVKYAKSPVYSYEFTHVPEYKPGLTIAGRICYKHYVCHAQELTYVFHSDEMYGIPLGDDFTADDEAASQHFMRHWVGFASGDINGLNPSVQWAPYSNSSLNLLEISATTRMRATDDICDFWDSLGYRF